MAMVDNLERELAALKREHQSLVKQKPPSVQTAEARLRQECEDEDGFVIHADEKRMQVLRH